jgi:glycosyltransferase involved in cell wall biosynthesis
MIPLLVDLETKWRGGQNQFLLLLKGLYERGHGAELVAVHGSSLSHRAKKVGIHVHSVSRNSPRLAAAAKIYSILSEGRVDLVHANEAHAVTSAWLGLTGRKLPFVISRRVGYPLRKGWIAQARYRRANCVLANSHWVANQVAPSVAAPEKLRVVYEGVEIPALPTPDERAEARARWSFKPSDRVLGCAGALQWDKGHEWVIRALPGLRKEFPDCKLLIAGEGKDRSKLEALATELKVKVHVLLPGFVKDVSSFYRAIDVFVFPSLFEGLGTSLLSAMAYCVPSVTFFGCALGEIVENGQSGLQVEAKNPTEIALAVSRLFRDSDFASKLATAGRSRVVEHFSEDHMVENTLAVYNQVLGNLV